MAVPLPVKVLFSPPSSLLQPVALLCQLAHPHPEGDGSSLTLPSYLPALPAGGEPFSLLKVLHLPAELQLVLGATEGQVLLLPPKLHPLALDAYLQVLHPPARGGPQPSLLPSQPLHRLAQAHANAGLLEPKLLHLVGLRQVNLVLLYIPHLMLVGPLGTEPCHLPTVLCLGILSLCP